MSINWLKSNIIPMSFLTQGHWKSCLYSSFLLFAINIMSAESHVNHHWHPSLSTCLNRFYFKGSLPYKAQEWLERYRPGKRVWRSALMVCWDSKTVMGLMCSSEGGWGRRVGGGNYDQEGNWTWISWWVWVKRHATLALRKRVPGVGWLWSVTCLAFGFMYLFSLPAPVGFQPNGEP